MWAQAEREREAFLAQRAQQALADAVAAEQTRQAEAAAATAHAAALARSRQVAVLLHAPLTCLALSAARFFATLVSLPDLRVGLEMGRGQNRD